MKSFKKAEIIIVFILLIASNTFGQNKVPEGSPQYLFNNFSNGVVLLKNKVVETALMNYNTLTEDIVFEQNGQLLNMANLSYIDTIYIEDTKFIPVEEAFYEVIATSPIPLFIQHHGRLSVSDKIVGYGGTSELSPSTRVSSVQLPKLNYNLQLPSDYKVDITPTYWLIKNGKMVSFTNVNQLRKHFPKKKNKIRTFIKKNDLRLEKREDLLEIIKFCGEESE